MESELRTDYKSLDWKDSPSLIPLSIQRKQAIVKRCNLAETLRHYDLEQHSHGVLSICLDLVRLLQATPLTQTEVELILRHDVAETLTGDLPWNVKNMNVTNSSCWDTIEKNVIQNSNIPVLMDYADTKINESLSPLNNAIFRLADMMELLLFCEEDIALGNRSQSIMSIRDNALKITQERILILAEEASHMGWNKEEVPYEILKYYRTSGFSLEL